MHSSITATIQAAHYAEMRADAERRRAAGPSPARFARMRSAWRARRPASHTIGRARAA